jgi:branched-subunit amino acid ABC-type transport system permease component
MPIIISITLAILITTVIGILIDSFIFQQLRRRNSSVLVLMLASIGVYVVGQNVLSMIFGDGVRSIQPQTVVVGMSVFGGRMTSVQFVITVTSAIAVASLSTWLARTTHGRSVRAISSNPELAVIVGVNMSRVTIIVVAIGSAIGALAGVLYSLDRDIVPTMGMGILLISVVVMIVGGQTSMVGLAAASFLVAIAQNLAVLWPGAAWQDAVIFLVLIIFLVFRPQGVLGSPLRKSSV